VILLATTVKISRMRPEERPRERAIKEGARCLSLRECLAILVGSGPPGIGCFGIADSVINRFGSSKEDDDFFRCLEYSAQDRMDGIPGLGLASRSRLLACFEIARRFSNYRDECQKKSTIQKPNYLSTRTLFASVEKKVLIHLRCDVREWFGFLPMFRSGKIGELTVTENGARTHVNVDPLEFFARVLALRPSGIFIFHNHPSGDLTPSQNDIDITKRVQELCTRLGLQFLGHAIVSSTETKWIQI